MDYVKAPDRNPYGGALADVLLRAKQSADQYEVKPWVPLLGGTGLGELFMGKAPELVDDMSYDGIQAAIRGGNVATGGVGTLRPDKRVLDASMLGLDAYGIGKGVTKLSKTGVNKLITNKVNKLVPKTSEEELNLVYNYAKENGGVFPSEQEGKEWLKNLLHTSKRVDLEEKHDLPVDQISKMLSELSQTEFQKQRGYSKQAIENWNSYLDNVYKGEDYNLPPEMIQELIYNPNTPDYSSLFKEGKHPLYSSTNKSRRDFLKKGSAVAGASTLGLGGFGALRKAGIETGEQVAKHATDNVVEHAAPKYKFNSLKEYNDYLTKEDALSFDRGDSYPTEWKRQLAEDDEALYKAAKKQIKDYGGGSPLQHSKLDEFSPQAKAEMKRFKNNYSGFQSEIQTIYGEPYTRHWSEVLDSYLDGDKYFQ